MHRGEPVIQHSRFQALLLSDTEKSNKIAHQPFFLGGKDKYDS